MVTFNTWRSLVDGSKYGGIPDSGISKEEDGDLTEYVGDTSYFSAETTPTINDSDYAILFSNDKTRRYAEASFESDTYNKFSMYVYPVNVNNEVMFVEASSGNVVFGIYFRTDGTGVYYSGSNATTGSIENNGSTERTGGTELVSGSNVSSEYYHIELLNIDWNNETLDIAVDGTTVVTGESFILSGVPGTFNINSNSGTSNPNTGGYVDKVDTGS